MSIIKNCGYLKYQVKIQKSGHIPIEGRLHDRNYCYDF